MFYNFVSEQFGHKLSFLSFKQLVIFLITGMASSSSLALEGSEKLTLRISWSALQIYTKISQLIV